MAHTMEREIREEVIYGGKYSHVNWGAIFAGGVLAMALSLLFYVLGSAIGISADVQSLEAATKGITFGTTLWLFFSYIASLFLGAYFSSCLARETDKVTGAVQGLTVWALLNVAAFLLELPVIYRAFPQTEMAVGRMIVLEPEGMWLTFFASLSSLLGAIFGGYFGARYVLNRYIHTRRWEHPVHAA